jgi:cytochrome bd-type quinol oxidase subunit 2
MKKALLSALIVVAIYFIILVSLLYGLRMDPSEGGPGWFFVFFVIGGTPAFLIMAVQVFFINYYIHRNPNSALALKIKTKAFQYPRNISLLLLVIVIIVEVLLNLAFNYYPSRELSQFSYLHLFPVFFLISIFIAYLVGLKEDKKKGDSTTSNLWKTLLSIIKFLIGWWY